MIPVPVPSGPRDATVTARAAGPAPAHLVPLARRAYARDVVAVARDLLGAYVSVQADDGTVVLRLTEVEAYAGGDDPASHAYRGRTDRNRSMFGEPGHLYVYRHLGLHHCVNVVCGDRGEPAAVLLRAGEVVEGAALARERRARVGTVDSDRQIARGPGRLAVALGLTLQDDGRDVTDAAGDVVLGVEKGLHRAPVSHGPRVGVAGEGADADRFPWRFWVTDDRTVSPFRPAYRRPRPD
ncbi:DNA-3-methyladenine glycosylase [Sediminihabitans luteus]|uniref:Putative 3-methyladenine DNA glycosylase n=1 Tax=Sediminihabitans luteus TaxID=1138585 RepID=A0A2M9CCT3_9CELL|nr:DNA-3-methyladenine glycosylase [Sediminihabitans luteus]PJJ69136.1 DNA-3-methyladenine glycosylase [Sediminihabitans luteus]GII99522.1 putative 3-methyladenine DNA glycosylase [Sediminihabitans luteus]